MCNRFNESELLKEVLSLKNENINTLIEKLKPILNLFSEGLDKLCFDNTGGYSCDIKILDFSLIIFLELKDIIENNKENINNKIKIHTNKSNSYATIISWLLNSFIKYILAYRKLFTSGLISPANIILRSAIELSELIVSMLYKPDLFDKYIEYSKLLMEDDNNVSNIWYKYLKPSKIRKILYDFENEVSSLETNIYIRRNNYYDYISKDVHNELLALNIPEPLESLTIILYYCFTFILQVNYLLQNYYNLHSIVKLNDYILHINVFNLLFEKFINNKQIIKDSML